MVVLSIPLITLALTINSKESCRSQWSPKNIFDETSMTFKIWKYILLQIIFQNWLLSDKKIILTSLITNLLVSFLTVKLILLTILLYCYLPFFSFGGGDSNFNEYKLAFNGIYFYEKQYINNVNQSKKKSIK